MATFHLNSSACSELNRVMKNVTRAHTEFHLEHMKQSFTGLGHLLPIYTDTVMCTNILT